MPLHSEPWEPVIIICALHLLLQILGKFVEGHFGTQETFHAAPANPTSACKDNVSSAIAICEFTCIVIVIICFIHISINTTVTLKVICVSTTIVIAIIFETVTSSSSSSSSSSRPPPTNYVG